MLSILSFICSLILYAFIAIGMMSVLLQSPNTRIPLSSTILIIMTLFILSLLKLVNSWPSIKALFNTQEPISHQLFSVLGIATASIITRSGALGILISTLARLKKTYNLSHFRPVLYGISLGILCCGVTSLLTTLDGLYKPQWANYSWLAGHSSALAAAMHALNTYIMVTSLSIIYCCILDRLHRYWKNRRWILVSICFATGIALAGTMSPEVLWLWPIQGIILGIGILIIYATIGRYSNHAIAIASATLIVGLHAQQALYSIYPHAILDNSIAIMTILTSAYIWCAYIAENN
jgi:hypothetical protein